MLGNVQAGNDTILLGNDSTAKRSICGHNGVSSDIAGSDVLLQRTFYVIGKCREEVLDSFFASWSKHILQHSGCFPQRQFEVQAALPEASASSVTLWM